MDGKIWELLRNSIVLLMMNQKWKEDKPKVGDVRCRVTKSFVCEYFEDRVYVSLNFSANAHCKRGFPTLADIDIKATAWMENHDKHIPDQVDVTRAVLNKILYRGQEAKSPKDASDPSTWALQMLYQNGILQAELNIGEPQPDADKLDIVYVFPTLLHQR